MPLDYTLLNLIALHDESQHCKDNTHAGSAQRWNNKTNLLNLSLYALPVKRYEFGQKVVSGPKYIPRYAIILASVN